jgi:hypothetical protein
MGQLVNSFVETISSGHKLVYDRMRTTETRVARVDKCHRVGTAAEADHAEEKKPPMKGFTSIGSTGLVSVGNVGILKRIQ